VNIPLEYDGQTLLDALCGIFAHQARGDWLARCESGGIVDLDRRPVHGKAIVRAGERYLNRFPAQAEPDVNPSIRILHEDEAIVVVDKPAPLPLHPSGRFNRNTLTSILNEVYRPQKLRPIHRLDANTTGIVVLARTRNVASRIQPQFSSGGIHKIYLARVHGWPTADEFTCTLPIADQAGELGTRIADDGGLPAHTDFRRVHRCNDRTSLLEVIPVTGRTNQIRVHLWQLGHAIVGDQTYRPDGTIGELQTLAVGDSPLCLHASALSLVHPISGDMVTFRSESPPWWEIPAVLDQFGTNAFRRPQRCLSNPAGFEKHR
jgi:RluA family pseudouridine synthase